ncbi:MAG: TIGR00725 family protein [Methanoregula sp.]
MSTPPPEKSRPELQIAVIGAGKATPEEYKRAYETGKNLAGKGVLLCGGLGGVMEAACRGARENGGTTIGIISGTGNGNAYLDVVIRTGLGHARNVLVVQSADAVIAVGGSYGTLSEIAVALKLEIPVFGIKTWDIPGVISCTSPEDAVIRAVGAARRSPLYNTRQAGSGSS